MPVKSGQFNYDAVKKDCPPGFTKITEGSAAVLEPPPKTKATAAAAREAVGCLPNSIRRTGDEEYCGEEEQAVFYNPAQVVNRDLSICAIELFSRLRLTEPRRQGGTTNGITILEALSATGLRAIRYFKEITNVRYIIANDMDADAVDCIVRNCAFNDIPVEYPTFAANMPASAIEVYGCDETQDVKENKTPSGSSKPVGVLAGGAVLPNLDDANDLMFRLAMNANVHPGQRMCLVDPHTVSANSIVAKDSVRPLLQQERMDVVDLDPYGSASPFLDAAFRCIKEGGLMLVTSTDSAILCGNFADTAHAKYSSLPYKAAHCHEAAVRTLLACIERAANKHKKYIVPLLSLHIDFYVRCFFRVYTQAAEVKLSACKLGYQLQCTQCSAFWVRPMAMARPPRPSRQERRRQKTKRNDKLRATSGDPIECSEGRAHRQGSLATVSETVGVAPASVHASWAQQGAKRVRDDDDFGLSAEENDEEQRFYKEVYPEPPNRQRNPRLAPLTVQRLPNVQSAQTSHPTGSNSCPVCGGSIALSGPLYAASTQNQEFLEKLLGIIEERAGEGKINAEARITGLVRTALEELPDCPLFYLLPDVASYVRVRCPPTPHIVGALARLGYRCSQVHCAAAGLKTDCPPEVLFGVMLQWKNVQDALDKSKETMAVDLLPCSTGLPENLSNPDRTSPQQPHAATPEAAALPRPLLVAPVTEANFDYAKMHDFRGRVTGVAKFVPNAPGWGPRRRHQGAAEMTEDNG